MSKKKTKAKKQKNKKWEVSVSFNFEDTDPVCAEVILSVLKEHFGELSQFSVSSWEKEGK